MWLNTSAKDKLKFPDKNLMWNVLARLKQLFCREHFVMIEDNISK